MSGITLYEKVFNEAVSELMMFLQARLLQKSYEGISAWRSLQILRNIGSALILDQVQQLETTESRFSARFHLCVQFKDYVVRLEGLVSS